MKRIKRNIQILYQLERLNEQDMGEGAFKHEVHIHVIRQILDLIL